MKIYKNISVIDVILLLIQSVEKINKNFFFRRIKISVSSTDTI